MSLRRCEMRRQTFHFCPLFLVLLVWLCRSLAAVARLWFFSGCSSQLCEGVSRGDLEVGEGGGVGGSEGGHLPCGFFLKAMFFLTAECPVFSADSNVGQGAVSWEGPERMPT